MLSPSWTDSVLVIHNQSFCSRVYLPAPASSNPTDHEPNVCLNHSHNANRGWIWPVGAVPGSRRMSHTVGLGRASHNAMGAPEHVISGLIHWK